MRPIETGEILVYKNPGRTELTTANLAAIDAAYSYNTLYPYAYSATVNDDVDSRMFCFSDAGSDLAVGQKVAMGLFLSAENTKGPNKLFQVSADSTFEVYNNNAAHRYTIRYFFGRKATNNTVVSSLVAASNLLAEWQYIPQNVFSLAGTATNYDSIVHSGLNRTIHSIYDSASPYVYCFGVELCNFGGTALTCKGSISLSFRKYTTEINHFTPRA